MTEQMEKATQNIMQMCDEVKNFAEGAINANLKSVKAATKSMDESAAIAGHMFHENISRLMNVGKTCAEAKSMHDVATMHQDFLKDCVDLWMAGASKLSEISARTAKDVVEPVAQHTNETITRIMQKSRAAAA